MYNEEPEDRKKNVSLVFGGFFDLDKIHTKKDIGCNQIFSAMLLLLFVICSEGEGCEG